jgi:hypothetical protein
VGQRFESFRAGQIKESKMNPITAISAQSGVSMQRWQTQQNQIAEQQQIRKAQDYGHGHALYLKVENLRRFNRKLAILSYNADGTRNMERVDVGTILDKTL